MTDVSRRKPGEAGVNVLEAARKAYNHAANADKAVLEQPQYTCP